MKRFVLVAGLVLSVVVAVAARTVFAAPQAPEGLVAVGGIYEVSFCGGGRVLLDYPEGYPIHIQVIRSLGQNWVEAEWAERVTDGRNGKELAPYRPHPQMRFNLNLACAVSQAIK
ncbi:MAG: hypothetical protein KAY59_00350 [Acidobacteria bacterium]|jgi:hypothetical protein|nr:hypothetical protein [Acidobacteriota bacterium]MBP8272844.1 hypothetical protein [Acidobacteriota bacterium]